MIIKNLASLNQREVDFVILQNMSWELSKRENCGERHICVKYIMPKNQNNDGIKGAT